MNNFLKNKKILLIIGGGISAYKSLELIRLLKKSEVNIKTILTSSGQKFVTPLSIESLTQNEVYKDLFKSKNTNEMDHIALSRWADVILIVPATANSIEKFANGRAEDLATTVVLASNKQIFLAPAMNVRMWMHEATKNNIKKLLSYGYQTIGPDIGDMACGEYGEGKMSNPLEIYNYLQEYFTKKNNIINKKITALVTAGATREYLDPVRYLTNKSSGKQGYEIAKSLSGYGIDTTLISGPTKIDAPYNVKVIKVETAQEMLDRTKETLPVDIAVCAAAVSDFRIKNFSKEKIKKKNTNKLYIDLEKNQDILEFISKHNSLRPKLVVGFSAETKNIVKLAKEKMMNKHCDWIVANNISKPSMGFESKDNEVSILYKNGKIETIHKNTKVFIANKIAKNIVDNFI